MILHKDGVFLLKASEIALLLRVNEYGLLEQLHFGSEVAIEDAEGLVCVPGLGWGTSILLKEGDTASCPDVLPLAWSGTGRGDYRETPLDIGSATDFRYRDFQILPGGVPGKTTLPQAKGVEETLEIIMEQPSAKLLLYFSVTEDAIIRRTVLENTGDTPICVHKLMSTMMDLPGSYEMTTFDGGWIGEMRKHTVSVADSRVVNESVTGFSSHRHNPGFLLSEQDATEDSGRVYGFNLIYSGNHYASAQRSFQGLTRVMQGIAPDHFQWELAPGAVLETPEAVMSFSQRGFGGLSEKMHRFVNKHIIPEYWQGRERPVLYNSWEGCMFDFNQTRLLTLAKKAKNLGCELFVLDDGWFGQRNHDKAGLGDYTVNRKKLPHGMEGLSRKIHELGMDFGLWFEPEAVNPDSDLYRAHPDWALTDGFEPLLGRHELLLDLTKQEVRDYIVENVSRILDSADIQYVKWDMNRHSIALGAKAHQYILGLYEVLDRIFGPRPQILLENCASGGNRFDLGMLCFGPQIWCSDNTDPIERLDIQENLSYLYPQSTFGAHVSAAPHAQTLRTTPLTTRGYVSFFGCLGYELDLQHLLPVEVDEIKGQIELYKLHRKTFQFGLFRRLKNGWQVSADKTVLAGVFHKQVSAAPGYEQLRLKDVTPDKTYRFLSCPQSLRLGQFGALIKHVAPINLHPNGIVLRTADKFYMLPSGTQSFTATGSALQSGVMLLPQFRGTGYDKNQHTQLDFSGNLYIAEQI